MYDLVKETCNIGTVLLANNEFRSIVLTEFSGVNDILYSTLTMCNYVFLSKGQGKYSLLKDRTHDVSDSLRALASLLEISTDDLNSQDLSLTQDGKPGPYYYTVNNEAAMTVLKLKGTI